MKFLVDAQLPRRLSDWLAAHDHESRHTSELPDANTTPDNDIARIADREDRVVITKDRDFRDSHLLTGKPERLLGRARRSETLGVWIGSIVGLAMLAVACGPASEAELQSRSPVSSSPAGSEGTPMTKITSDHLIEDFAERPVGAEPVERHDGLLTTDLVEILALAVRESCSSNFCAKARPVYVVVPDTFDVDVSAVAFAVRRESDLLAEPVDAKNTESLYSDVGANLAGGGTIVSIRLSREAIDGIYALDVSVIRSRHEVVIETYLFKPNDDRTWVLVPHDVVGVTLTSSVS